MHSLVATAYAKLNLTLEVLGRRNDGYHEIATSLQSISLADKLTFSRTEANITFECNVKALESPDNLAHRAARLLAERHDVANGVHIALQKCIPSSAGLGGGSADAAATLLALNQLWELDLPQKELLIIGKQLGSDVPFCISGGTAKAHGRGEEFISLVPLSYLWITLLCPNLNLPNKTATMYTMLKTDNFTRGEATDELAHQVICQSPIRPGYLLNVFEKIAQTAFPNLSEFKDAMHASGAQNVHLSGTGPALFSLGPDKPSTEAIAARLRKKGLEAYSVHTVARGVELEWRQL